MTIPSISPRGPGTARDQIDKRRFENAPMPPSNSKSMVTRQYRVASLRADGSIENSEQAGPAFPPFEAAFSAFTHGTLIKTAQGPVAIEDLEPGMKLVTAEYGATKLTWIGSMTLTPLRDPVLPDQTRLIRVMAQSFGLSRPSTDVIAGPGARILTRPPFAHEQFGAEQILCPLSHLIDGVNVIDVAPPSPVKVYHLCLPRHATITAAGLRAETFHPGPGFERTMGPNMLAFFLSFFPHVRSPRDFGDLMHPRLPIPAP